MKKWLYFLFLSTILLCFSISAQEPINKNPDKTGIITALDLAARTIQIDGVDYSLSDQLKVYNIDAFLSNQLVLQVGQKIAYWKKSLSAQPDPKLPKQTIIQIRLTSTIKEVAS